MCGIAGMAGRVDPKRLMMMTRSLAHRGPDGEGVIWSEDEQFGLGHRRLAILDLSDAARQPMCAAGGRHWIAFNGEIFNFLRLRDELEREGYRFHTNSDTEVILAAYDHWGERCVEHLNGMFAFGLWDTNRRCLLLARDRLGIKPLYWARHDEGIIFASEAKTVVIGSTENVHSDPEVDHNPWHFPTGTRTGFRGVERLPPGHMLRWHDGQLSLVRWWQLSPNVRPIDDAEAESKLEELLRDATAIQMISDVPVGALLSGGLDSSIVAAVMDELTPEQIHTFTICFRSEDRRFEAMPPDDVWARRLATQRGFRHHEIEIQPDIVELLPELVWHIDEPLADPAAINTHLISKAAREQGILVLLNGMGGDEVFGGYRKHLACLYADVYQKWLPSFARKSLERVVGWLPVATQTSGFRTLRWAKRFFGFASEDSVSRFLLADQSVDPALYAKLFVSAEQLPYDRLAEVRHRRVPLEEWNFDYLTRMCLSDTTIFLPDHNLNYVDKAAMSVGVEGRQPLLDHRIVEFMFSLPPRFRIRGRRQKWLLRQIASQWLDKSIVDRPKAPFGAPLRAWIRRDLAKLVDEVLSEESLKKRGLYDYSTVRHLIDLDRRGVSDYSALIWTILTREMWFRTFIDSDGRLAHERARLADEVERDPPQRILTGRFVE